MTDEKAREVLGDVRAYLASRASLKNEMLANHTFTDICNAIKALEQQPCEDTVSRQKVLQCIKESREGIDWGQSEDEDAFLHYSAALYRTIASKECLPSVTSQPKTGRWIKVTNGRGGHECDVCHDYAPSFQNGDEYLSTFCPNCGAKMEGGNADAEEPTK